METFFNRFVFCLLPHLFAMEKVAPVPLFKPSCGRIFHKNRPLNEFCNVILSRNFYFKKKPKMIVFCRKISQYLVT